MLTEQNVIMELTDCSDTVPIGFITTDDGHTLLAVGEHEDGTLEFMAAPIALMPQNNMVSPALIKTVDGSFILHPSVFQLNVDGLSGTVMQQTNLLPLMQHFEDASAVTEQLKVQGTNECGVTESLLPIRDNSNVLSDKGQSTVDNHAKNESTTVSTIQNAYKRSPGRPKKTGVTLQNALSLKCDICRQEFTKQTLYRRHMENHAQEKPHRCPKCPASFNIPTNFTLHMAAHNTGDPKCPECGRKYARMASLKSHMLLHEKEENLFCTECEDAFSTKDILFTGLFFGSQCDSFLIPGDLNFLGDRMSIGSSSGDQRGVRFCIALIIIFYLLGIIHILLYVHKIKSLLPELYCNERECEISSGGGYDC